MSRATKPMMQRDCQGNVLHDSQLDVTVRCEWSGGNIIYKGQARVGAGESDAVWQIMQLNYVAGELVSKLYPTNASSVVSSDYEFSWTDRATYTYA